MNEFHYFTCPIYRVEKPEWVVTCLDLLEPVFNIQKSRDELVVVQTENLINNKNFIFLKEYFFNISLEVLFRQGYRLDQHDFFISNMWGQEFGCHGYNSTHVHSNTIVSGFYFLKTPENGPYPIFEDPRQSKLMCDLPLRDYENVYSSTPAIHFNNLIPGTVISTNSWIPHRFTQNHNEQTSKFIHFTLSVR